MSIFDQLKKFKTEGDLDFVVASAGSPPRSMVVDANGEELLTHRYGVTAKAQNDVEFIALAHNAMPALLAAVEFLEDLKLDLEALGFSDPDNEVNGGDTVEKMGEYYQDVSAFLEKLNEKTPKAPESDFGRTAAQLEAKHGNEHPVYTREDWRTNVGQGYTKLGYWDWVLHNVESNYYEACEECGHVECDKVFIDAETGYVCQECADAANAPDPAAVAEEVDDTEAMAPAN